MTPEECPPGMCECCHNIGHESKRTCVVIPGPKSKARRRYNACEACAKDLVRHRRHYIILRILPGGVPSRA